MAWTTLLLVMSTVFAIYVRAEQTNSCLQKCAQDMLRCQRFETLGLLSEVECCDKYTLCYYMCQPDAVIAPRCSSKDKRGSWNKRHATQGSLRNREWIDVISLKDDLSEENQFYA